MKLRLVAVAIVIALAAGLFLLLAEPSVIYTAVAAFYLPSTVPLLMVFGGAEAAPRWAWYVAYLGGPLLQNALLVWFLFWLHRRFAGPASSDAA